LDAPPDIALKVYQLPLPYLLGGWISLHGFVAKGYLRLGKSIQMHPDFAPNHLKYQFYFIINAL